MIDFGGKDYRYKLQAETFTIEQNKIVRLSNKGPSGRHSFGFTYDRQAKVAYLYGGKEYQADSQTPLGDFWKWDGASWVPIK